MEHPQNISSSSDAPRIDGRKLAEAIAALHGAIPIAVKGEPFNPAVAVLLRRIQTARAVPPSDTSRCKQKAA